MVDKSQFQKIDTYGFVVQGHKCVLEVCYTTTL